MEEFDENFKRQQEEIEALSSIYEDSFILESERSFTILIKESNCEASLSISFPPEYPSTAPPTYHKSAPFLRGQEKQTLCNKLDNIYLDNLGESVVFLWVEEIRTYLQDYLPGSNLDNLSEQILEDKRENFKDCSLKDPRTIPNITTGDIIEDRKSVFQGHTATVKSIDDVKSVLSKLYENKKIAHATHNIYAYRIFSEEKQSWLCDCEDDGEDAAGGRLLHLLEILDAVDTMVVVSRWYGGILLGPDRFKHINNAARSVLDSAGVILPKDEKGKKKKGNKQ